MKCVIIGLGWLGLPLAKELVAVGFSVTGTTRQRTVLSDEINLLNYEPENGVSTDLKRALTAADCVVLAFPPNRSSFEQYASDCVQIGGECSKNTRILMISSTGVYPEKNGFVVETDTDLLPDTTNSLLFAERSLGSILGNRLTIIRMAGLIGGNRYPVRAMAASGKSYTAHELVNVVHQNDAVACCLHVIKHGRWGITVNCCTSEHPTKKAFYSWMASQLKSALPEFVESAATGKIVRNDKSLEIGFKYRYHSPFDFPI
jgi:nucleoside-diphosphate-sugar epimerase